jgi:predicted nucleotidyltransferase
MALASGEYLDADTERAARTFVDRVSKDFDVLGAVVFGSRARRRHRPDSDADIAILLRGKRGSFLGTKLALADMAFDVLLDTGVLIQPLPVWEDEWEHPETYSNPELLRNIHREGIRL